jgi:hypothetical protein
MHDNTHESLHQGPDDVIDTWPKRSLKLTESLGETRALAISVTRFSKTALRSLALTSENHTA